MFAPHPSNPILYKLKIPNHPFIYGSYDEIKKKVQKFNLDIKDFVESRNKYRILYMDASFNSYIEIMTATFIRDCINPICEEGYRYSIISALIRNWGLRPNIDPQILWKALGPEFNNFTRQIFLAPYKINNLKHKS